MATHAVKYDSHNDHSTQSTTDVPLVKTEKRTVTYESGGNKDDNLDPGILVSAQSHSSRSQTIETTTVSLSAAPSIISLPSLLFSVLLSLSTAQISSRCLLQLGLKITSRPFSCSRFQSQEKCASKRCSM